MHLAADKLTGCRQRIQRNTTGRRGRAKDPLYNNRKTLLTRLEFLTPRQKQKLEVLWATDPDYVGLEVTWGVYQRIIDAYNTPNKRQGRNLMRRVIESLRSKIPAGLEEL
ncbi:transposase, partial [Corynebacterium falsenii]|uniref:transposase n=1 Tax=Corynebacterium falsenii TaxID=108486 RepID=UPI00234D3BC0